MHTTIATDPQTDTALVAEVYAAFARGDPARQLAGGHGGGRAGGAVPGADGGHHGRPVAAQEHPVHRVSLAPRPDGTRPTAPGRPGAHTGGVPVSAVARRGVVRLLNTSGGRVLVLAGEVDATAVEAFRRCYGAEPVRVDVVDARSVTALSPSGRELLTDTLQWAEWTGRTVTLRSCPLVRRALPPGS